jgi:hypothetical protein
MTAGVTNETDLRTDKEDEHGTATADQRRARAWLLPAG